MSEDFKVQWNIKAGMDMLNLRGDSVVEVQQQLNEVLSGDFIQKASEAAELFRAAQVVAAGLGGPQGAPQAPPAAPSAAPGATVTQLPTANNAPRCAHGFREFKEGDGAKGHWKAWFCPLPKGSPGQCEPEWVR